MKDREATPNMPATWMDLKQWLRSPCCRQPLVAAETHASCSECGMLYRNEGGILILLPPNPHIKPA